MKSFNYLLICFFFLLLSCGSDESNVLVIENPDGTPTTDDDPSTGEVSFALVNAFPSVSFSQPVDLQSANDGSNRIFVVEKGGRIQVLDNSSDTTEASVFLDLGNVSTVSEQGLLGLAFHPNFDVNGYFYVYYNPTNSLSRISRFTASSVGSMISLDTELVLLEFAQPFVNHNGGQLAFGPDGFLYIASGDGGSGGDPQNNAQNRGNLLGAILRIDVDNPQGDLNYGIPQENPFVGDANAREEIYAYGLRNPWRMSFDTQTGDLWTGDVGQNEIEEIDVITNGGNYGWRLFEGTSCFSGDCDTNNLIPPIFEYGQNNGDKSITGGYVYRGTENTFLVGRYVYGDFVSGRIWALDTDGNNNELLLESELAISSFGTDANGEIYVCAFGGTIYRLEERIDTSI